MDGVRRVHTYDLGHFKNTHTTKPVAVELCCHAAALISFKIVHAVKDLECTQQEKKHMQQFTSFSEKLN